MIVLCQNVFFFNNIKPVNAQISGVSDTVCRELVSAGFENVFVSEVEGTIVIGYENRRFRFEPKGCSEVMKIIDQVVEQDRDMMLIIFRNKIPLLFIEYNTLSFSNFISNKISSNEFFEELQVASEKPEFEKYKAVRTNRSEFKADVALGPNVSLQFGDWDRNVQSNINLIPELNTMLTKGLTLTAQALVPLYNNFLIPEQAETQIRPGIIALNQMIRIEDNVFLNASLGYFTRSRAGFDIELRKYFGEGNFSLSLNTGYTVYKSFSPKLIEYFEDDNYFTGIVSAEYRYCPYDLTFGVKAGNFLYNNIAARFDLLRQFGELKIGFFATVTKSSDFNGGFNFSIPLPPGKYMRIKYLRVRQSKDFSLEYRAKGFSKSVGTYDTGSQLYNILMEYNADFFKKRLIKELF